MADFDDVKSGFVISFAFEEGNPFLLDAALTKEFRFTADGSLTVSSTVGVRSLQCSSRLRAPDTTLWGRGGGWGRGRRRLRLPCCMP